MLIPMIAIVAFAAIRIARIFADRPAGSSPDLTDRVAELEREVRALHSYDTPEIVAIPIVAGSAAYLEWLFANTELLVGGARPPS